MPDENTNPAAVAAPVPTPVTEPVSDVTTLNPVIVDPTVPDASESTPEQSASVSDIPTEVVRKIGEARNVLIALSSDPSVDEMAAAIGLSLFLDKLGKRATAIYSGATPNALEFLKPEETFESTADTLQDFVIALNKDKADHLRYKLDGEFVKIYITPYKTRISEEDLEFSYGDFNVDLVLALDVANGVDLDSALREHGRIMHDASIVNITTGNPGKLGEIEWSDKSASSVSEMIAKLLYSINGAEIEKEEATAFLTGIVAATNRFSNAGTTPETMRLSSRLMESGANQQLISKNITPDVENEMINMLSANIKDSSKKSEKDPTKLDIEHGYEEGVDESKEVDATVTEKESTLLDDLKEAEANLAQAGDETVPEANDEPLKIASNSEETNELEVPEGIEQEAKIEAESNAEKTSNQSIGRTDDSVKENEAIDSDSDKVLPVEGEKVIQPSIDLGASAFNQDDNSKYGQMLEDALESAGGSTVEPTAPIMSPPVENPAAVSAPTVPTAPEINGVPDINYMPMPGDAVLPPPPTPPLDVNAPMPEANTAAVEPSTTVAEPATAAVPVEPITPAAPVEAPATEPLGAQPAMQDQVYAPQAADPGAFKIPGM